MNEKSNMDRQHTLNESGLPQTSEERKIQYETKRAILILQHPEVLEEQRETSPTATQPQPKTPRELSFTENGKRYIGTPGNFREITDTSPTATQAEVTATRQRVTAPQHSPLPWRISDNGLAIVGRTHSDTVVFSSNGESMINGEANAAYIVRACNAYPHAERLAEALKAVKQAMIDEANDGLDRRNWTMEQITEALKAYDESK
jgi:hypothetical protein